MYTYLHILLQKNYLWCSASQLSIAFVLPEYYEELEYC